MLATLCTDLNDNQDNKDALVFVLFAFSQPGIVIDKAAAVSTGLVEKLENLAEKGEKGVKSLAKDILRLVLRVLMWIFLYGTLEGMTTFLICCTLNLFGYFYSYLMPSCAIERYF